MKTYKKSEITNDLVQSLIGKQITIKYHHYSYHQHLTTRTGEVKVTKDNFIYVDAQEAVGIDEAVQIIIE